MEAEPSKAEPPKRKRRRFQFRLRTLMIVVTLLAGVCGYVAHEAKIVRDRNAWLRTHSQKSASGFGYGPSTKGDRAQRPGLIRQWLGDEEKRAIYAVDHTPSGLATAAELFPEATIFELYPSWPEAIGH
jgi:hypothetical protein